jgi:uncharacterized membrane protein
MRTLPEATPPDRSTGPQSAMPPREHGPKASARLRNYFVTGIVVIGPIAITVYLARLVINYIDDTVKPLIPLSWNPDTYLPFALPGFGILVAVLGITLLGFLAANIVGKTMFSFGDQIVERMPVVRSVYKTFKQIFETVLADRATSFKQAALIEWPRAGIHSIVFVTGTATGEIAERLSKEGEEIVSVFIPTTPNPTGGYLMFLPRSSITLLDMSVEDAIKLVISGGLVTPPQEPRGAIEEAIEAAHGTP